MQTNQMQLRVKFYTSKIVKLLLNSYPAAAEKNFGLIEQGYIKFCDLENRKTAPLSGCN